LYLRVAQVPRSRDMAIFLSTDRQTDRQTDKPIALSLAAHARTRGNDDVDCHYTRLRGLGMRNNSMHSFINGLPIYNKNRCVCDLLV
jgi:hypothetical protein